MSIYSDCFVLGDSHVADGSAQSISLQSAVLTKLYYVEPQCILRVLCCYSYQGVLAGLMPGPRPDGTIKSQGHRGNITSLQRYFELRGLCCGVLGERFRSM